MKRLIYITLVVLLLISGCSYRTIEETTPSTLPATEPPTEPSTEPTATEVLSPIEPVFDPNKIMDAMTTEELVGQLFLARCPVGDASVTELQRYQFGGYILFGKNFKDKSPDDIISITDAYQDAAKIPILIAVDEEGGVVNRVSSNSAFRETPFPSLRNLYQTGGLPLILETEEEKCRLLCNLGINVNMAPVCDISTESNAFMYSRSLGQSPEITGDVIANIAKTMASKKIGSVLKHFPGYGNNPDTHTGIAVDSRSITELESADLVPFRAGIAAGCDAILVSHTVVECLDAELPASLSPSVIGYLRNDMGFEGVIVTDDLIMQAITDSYGTGEAAVLAVLAGNDLLCSSEYGLQYNAVLDAVNNGRIPQARIKASVARILQWKHNLGLIPLS